MTGTRSATADLLWAAIRRTPEPSEVHGALDRGADVEVALRAAARHRILGLLWRALGVAGSLEALGTHAQAVAELVELQRMRDLLLVPEALERAVQPLTKAGMEPVVLKGPTVARRYPDLGLRPYDDLDVLVPRGDHARAIAVLGAAGWELVRTSRRDRYDSVLRHPAVPGMPLELHYGLDGWYDRANTLRADELWRRRVPVSLSGVEAFGLLPADDLVMLSAHAAKPYHGFDRLVWVADLVMLTGDLEEHAEMMDWQSVRDLAVVSRCTTAVGVALALAAMAGAPVRSGFLPLPVDGWRAAALASVVDRQWPLQESPPIHLRFALADSRRRRAALLVGYTHGFPPVASVVWYLRSIGWAWRRLRTLHRTGAEPEVMEPSEPS
ncbi:MAG: nucleotidyltransferase domain-containing protein [Acidimicrobiales bacterium]